ncbi:hypothetical protein [Brevundimonas diminuta]|uniref:Uncharacterized protein n=1 Tax=Brevundimonas diminuta TaxID=293 RepID=A0A2X1CH11_BREDI|nr:hypothetical protein [Brevundimonas diminuta]SPU45926.1 Uncharacterised protein [Brevundimonas diminuta]
MGVLMDGVLASLSDFGEQIRDGFIAVVAIGFALFAASLAVGLFWFPVALLASYLSQRPTDPEWLWPLYLVIVVPVWLGFIGKLKLRRR